MTEVVATRTVLSDSTFKTRPDFKSYVMTDANAGGTSVEQIEEQRRIRQMKFPSLVGRKDVESFKDPQNLTDPAFRKWNDEGDHRPPAPFRSCDNIIDPVSGFVSVCGDKDRNTGHTKIRSLVQLSDTPNTRTPQTTNSIRMYRSAPPETQRRSVNDPGTPYAWSGRKVSDASLRASLGGWTSDRDPRLKEENTLRGDASRKDESQKLRDALALKYLYTSSTQRSYEEVPWNNMLAPRKWAPVSTLEQRPDMVSQKWSNKRYAPSAQEWQDVGRSWDMFQTRKGFYKDGPIPGIVFCEPLPRAGHIPAYSGCVGAENLEEFDNAKEPFHPFTNKRSDIPRYTDTSHRPNIPGYKGCTWYKPNTVPAHSNQTPPEPQTTARVHRSLPVTPNNSQFRRSSQMSKMVTTVPPCNPFNSLNQDAAKPQSQQKSQSLLLSGEETGEKQM